MAAVYQPPEERLGGPGAGSARLLRSPDEGERPVTGSAGASSPVLVAVDDDPALLVDVERALGRYAGDYRVCCLRSADEALATLDQLAEDGARVAVVLAGEELGGAPGTTLLAEVRRTHRHAQRVLLIGWDHLGGEHTGRRCWRGCGAPPGTPGGCC